MYKAVIFDFFGVLYVKPQWEFVIDQQVIDLIKKLKPDYKIGLLSNSTKGYIRQILEEQEITDLFDEIIVSSEAGVTKPNSKIFNLTLEKLEVKPDEAIFIDDNDYNVEAARNLGIESILYTDLASLKEKLETYLL